MAWDMDDYLYEVATKNNHFERHKNSSLHTLNKALKKNLPANDIRLLIAAIPADKQQKYKAALDYVKANYPQMNAAPVPVAPTAPAPQPHKPHGGPAGAFKLPALAPSAAVRNVAAIEAQLMGAAEPALPVGGLTRLNGIQLNNFVLIPDPYAFTAAPPPHVGPLTKPQLQQMNEATANVQAAIELSVAAIARIQATPAVITLEQQLYTAYFGAFDAARKAQIRANFMSMAATLSGSRGGTKGQMQLVDARNDNEKMNWLAATHRGSASNGIVVVYIGREFFLNTVIAGFRTAMDFTIGTMVHELAHACFSASDVPTVAAGGKSQLGGNGMPIPLGPRQPRPVANDADSDMDLAAADPDAAMINADNYGQFAWRLLAKVGP